MKKITLGLLALVSLSEGFASVTEIKEKVRCTNVQDYIIYDKEGVIQSEAVDFTTHTELTRTTLKEGELEIRTASGLNSTKGSEDDSFTPSFSSTSINKVQTTKNGAFEVEKMEVTVMYKQLSSGRYASGLTIDHRNDITENHYIVSGNKKTLVKTIHNGKKIGKSSSVETTQVDAKTKVITTTLLAPEVYETGDYVIKTTKSVQICEAKEI